MNIEQHKGKLPPQAVDLEEAVLGALMVDSKAIYEAVDKLNPEVFYRDSHKEIYKSILTLFNDNKPIDLLTVSQELKSNLKLDFVGGDYYLIQLTQKIASSAHIEYHCRIILQKYIQRQCISFSSETIEKSYSEDFDVFELLEKVYKDFGSINDVINVGTVINFRDGVLNYLRESEKSGDGIKSSINDINSMTGGYYNSDLIILAARPGMGKTSFILNELLFMAFCGIPVALFSMEMSFNQIIGRLLSIISGIDSSLIRNSKNLSISQRSFLIKCSEILSKLPIYIDDTPALSPLELKLKLSKFKRENNVQIGFVDYLQLMKVKDRKVNREQEVSIISGSLKGIAKELDIPIISLSQLSRSVESRGGSKRPLLSDLRDSGSIEQDADMVLFLYRPEYYKIDEWDDEERSPTKNTAEVDVAKFRHGETGFIRVGCNLAYMRFYDINSSFDEIQNRYLKEVETQKEFEIPKINPSEAFIDNNDLPF